MTIEGGCFTTALLTKHHITELFDENEDEKPAEIANEAQVVTSTSLSSSTLPTSEPITEQAENETTELVIYLVFYFVYYGGTKFYGFYVLSC